MGQSRPPALFRRDRILLSQVPPQPIPIKLLLQGATMPFDSWYGGLHRDMFEAYSRLTHQDPGRRVRSVGESRYC
jgi:hypothetical protein